MVTDAELIRRYAEEKSEAAFADLVRRHLDLVYSAALRRLAGDTHAAADVTQLVFTALARQAAALTRGVVLPAWLYATTRNVAVDFIRTEQRRRTREQEAHTMHETISSPEPTDDWEQLRPFLDTAMDELAAIDREAVLLRYFAKRPFAEIGAALRVSEDAARMRVERALEKLRALLARRGIKSSASAVGVVLAGQAVSAAPAGMAGSVASAVAASTGALAGATTWAGLAQFMANTKLSLGVGGLIVVVAMGVAVRNGVARSTAEGALAAANREHAARMANARDLEARVAAAEREMADRAKRIADVGAAAEKKAAIAAVAATAQPTRLSPGAEAKRFLARHPEVDRALHEWAIACARTEWASFIREHGLTAAQIEEFLPLVYGVGLDPGPGPDGTELMLDAMPVLSRAERRGRLTELLGERGWEKTEVFRGLLPVRNFADKVAGALCFSEAPLTTEQWQGLVQVLARNPAKGDAAQTMRFDWDGVVDHARGMLSPTQLTALDRMRMEDRLRQALDELSRRARK
ncbi:MAG: sigma-70 family RNA polymerase sigma factor [Opitutaceae bacterium]